MCAVTSNEKPVCSHKYCGSTIINKQKELDRNSDPAQLKQKTFFFFYQEHNRKKYSDNMDLKSLKINISSSVDIAGFVLSFGRKMVLLPHWRTEKGAKPQLVTVTIRYTTNASTKLIISKSSLAHLYL